MIYKYQVDIAVCWTNGTWTWEMTKIESASPLLEHEILETVSENFNFHPKNGDMVTTGLIGYREDNQSE
jgi:hypothetical protein